MLFISHDIALLERHRRHDRGHVRRPDLRDRPARSGHRDARNTPTPRPCSMPSSASPFPAAPGSTTIPGDPPDPTQTCRRDAPSRPAARSRCRSARRSTRRRSSSVRDTRRRATCSIPERHAGRDRGQRGARMTPTPLLEVRDLSKHYPVRKGLLGRETRGGAGRRRRLARAGARARRSVSSARAAAASRRW